MDQDFDDHPDWGRALVPPASVVQPVGDPTRWGASGITLLSAPGTGEVFATQIIQAATRDGYSRSWSLNGSLSLPADLWNYAFTSVALEIQMGVGQAQVLHKISLFEGTPVGGLCYTQYFPNGGPYLAYSTPTLSTVGGTIDRTRCFAAIGALIGSTINIRAVYTIGAAGAPAVFPTRSQINLVLSPFAAGHGL